MKEERQNRLNSYMGLQDWGLNNYSYLRTLRTLIATLLSMRFFLD